MPSRQAGWASLSRATVLVAFAPTAAAGQPEPPLPSADGCPMRWHPSPPIRQLLETRSRFDPWRAAGRPGGLETSPGTGLAFASQAVSLRGEALMGATRRSRVLGFAVCALLLAADSPSRATDTEEAGASCRALYLTKLRAARDAAARGDQDRALENLEEAEAVLRACTGDPSTPGGAREDDGPAHVLGRAGSPSEALRQGT